jgi:hypothetical protein
MRKLGLSEWAAISEIAGTLVVIVSLIFVIYSIERNTAVLAISNDNFLYQLDDDFLVARASDPELVSIILRFDNDEELSEIERARYIADRLRRLIRWDMAHARYLQGVLTEDSWENWNKAFSAGWPESFPERWWEEERQYYSKEFVAHVDAVYAMQ